ncbi:OmpA family protein [Flavobacterium urocaniciphilum]|uniref:OmpA family protein n=1 Tax=Flavobacterium urocaniciphilum TaxID=1299341 RepID=A0A1H8Z3E1_9FLAO|nr:OmpA family protein [Flavobacterium urocaniciphilum]SEP58896.1 OmpA family protein [Flavobacterium urocaniciphilum]
MKYILISILSFFYLNSYSQKRITLYFDVNSYELNKTEFKKFSVFMKTKDLKIQKVIGYCDLRSFDVYNDTLALKRANFVSSLIKLIDVNSNFEIEYKGQNFNQDKVSELTRKVEIYFKIEKTLPINITKDNELAEVVKKSKIGDKLVLKNLSFYDRTDILYPESYKIREELLQVLKDNPKIKIEIQGHICCTPGKDEEEIALKRCLGTIEYLVINGIDKSRLKYKSFDATQPIYPIPEKNEEQKKANRRVEILILDK